MRPVWLLIAVCLQALVVVLWATMLRRFMPRVKATSFARVMQATALTAATVTVVPAIAGHASSIAFFIKRCRLTLTECASMIAGEQVAETLAKVTVILLALMLAPASLGLHQAALRSVLMLSGLVGLAIVIGITWKRAPDFLRSPRALITGYAIGISIKAAEGAALYAVQRSLGFELGANVVIVILGVIALGIAAATVIPIPGPVGVGEALVAAAYTQLGLSWRQSLALVALQTGLVLATRFSLAALLLLAARERMQFVPQAADVPTGADAPTP